MEKNHRKNNIKKVEYLIVIAENIESLRKRLGISREDPAKRDNVGRSKVLPACQVNEISLKRLFQIVEASGIEQGNLFLTEKDREKITYKTKVLIHRLSKIFDLEEKKNKQKAAFSGRG